MYRAGVRRGALQATALLISSFLLLLLVPARHALAADVTEESFRSLMNAERVERNRGRLKMQEALVAVARQQSGAMANSGSIFHNPDLANDLNQVSWSIAGENVGVGNSVDSLHQAFMNSAPHRKNIVRRVFKRVGVGVVTADGRIWVTVVFAG
jgi:uncharacterized protein YkwD